MLTSTTDLDIRLLRIFLAIVDAGGVSAAQGALGVGQSTISEQLATLEVRLGFTLCERGRGGFRLTAKGERFVRMARGLLNTLSDFSAEARNMDKKLVGRLTLGLCGHSTMQQNVRMAQAIERFRQRDEAVRLSLRVCGPRELEGLLLQGEIQVAIGYFWHRVPFLDYTPLYAERQVACCGPSHPLAARAGRATQEDVAQWEWAWRTYPVPEAEFPDWQARVTAEADNMEAVAMLVLSGAHLGYLPEHFCRPYIEAGLLHALNPEVLHYDVTFRMVTRRRAALDEVTRAFVADMRAGV
ncbi:LysR family transcriptional regulator [Achromobacter insolitus]|uniref:LysR family transcriptional regulator n=1 Tax=Achromobacter insolitus TaxID=217204 RepID=UPI0007C80DC8|nr:LysR family transcriptional regulator [Achromobacter insolitus]MCP1401871.1 DNA-binding transcriptional LysR family regulator [Achromobacter insolitus]OAE60873.1 LysR family transcriptional regulator [Achromobacter insolitus]OCZ56737.1 LysR family transcriptional regulator [Achromobacter insolitus]